MSNAHVMFQVSHLVHAPSAVVWRVLGDFGNEHRWTRTLAHCERDTATVAIGTRRTCTLPKPLMGRLEVSEQLTQFQYGVSLAYQLEGAAGPFASAASRWSTVGDDARTVVTVEGQFVPRNRLARFMLWPLVKPYLSRLTRNVLREFATFVQAGPRTAT